MSAEINEKILFYAMDDDFIKWVQSGFTFNNDHWQSLRNKNSESESIEEAIQIVESLEFDLPPVDQQQKKSLFEAIEKDIGSEPKKAKSFNLWMPLSIAASILLVVAFYWQNTKGIDNVSTELAQTEVLDLPDNSLVTLNADSKISYRPKKFMASRQIQLEGEAFFEVEKGTDFIVNTPDVKVEVLGTSFNVFSRSGYAEVYCETGKVKVSKNKEDSGLILLPGESAVYKDSQLKKNETSLGKDWRNGNFRYRDAELGLVLDELGRQFGVEISANLDIRKIKYTGFFDTKELGKALESVLWPLKLKYNQSSSGKIEIEKN